MAVVQISRIQIRRGKALSGTGFPQLASGELGWAIDTQELYVGNGSVSEGAPAVGNTKILTENDFKAQGNILNLLQHIYKVTDTSLVTGPDINSPITRDLQVRLDDRVVTANFGTIGDGVTDDTPALQRAIDQLFLNVTAPAWQSPAGIPKRVILELLPGKYNINNTLYIPSYATIIGAGIDKTIISHAGAGPIIRFVNDTSTAGNPSSIETTTGITQPRNIELSNLTLETASYQQEGIILDAVRDSLFENIKISGQWDNNFNSNSIGIKLNALSDIVTSEHNTFRNVTVNGFSYAVFAKQDINFNTFDNCYIYDARQGFVLGEGANQTSIGEQYGPRNTSILNCTFGNTTYGIKRHAVLVSTGRNNIVRGCNLTNVGNDGGNAPIYPQIYFAISGNVTQSITSDRAAILGRDNLFNKYVPEVGGSGTFSFNTTRHIPLGDDSVPTFIFRLPVSSDVAGVSAGSISYNVHYIYKSAINDFSRRGTLNIVVDITNAQLQLSDDYSFTANDPNDVNALKLEFVARLIDEIGDPYVGSPQTPSAIWIGYTNLLDGDAGTISYTYDSQFFDL